MSPEKLLDPLTSDEKVDIFNFLFKNGDLEKSQVDAVEECPHCHSKKYIKNGKDSHGNQRYFCKKCGKTYINTTKRSPLHGLKMNKKSIIMHIYCLTEGYSLDKTVYTTGNSKTTAFRFRHRIMSFIRATQEPMNPGKGMKLQVDATFLRENRKGTEQNPNYIDHRKPRHNGSSSTYQTVHDCILFGISNQEDIFASYCGYSEKQQVVMPILKWNGLAGSIIETDYRSCYRKIPDMIHAEHHMTSSKKLYKINAIHSKFKRFIRNYISVASKYLHNYVATFVLYHNSNQSKFTTLMHKILTLSKSILKEKKNKNIIQFI